MDRYIKKLRNLSMASLHFPMDGIPYLSYALEQYAALWRCEKIISCSISSTCWTAITSAWTMIDIENIAIFFSSVKAFTVKSHSVNIVNMFRFGCFLSQSIASSHGLGCYQGCSPRPTPPGPAEKRASPPREKQALPRPAPQKLTKPAGRNGAKLTVDCTDYALTFGLKMGK